MLHKTGMTDDELCCMEIIYCVAVECTLDDLNIFN